jgi:hypothetical protein
MSWLAVPRHGVARHVVDFCVRTWRAVPRRGELCGAVAGRATRSSVKNNGFDRQTGLFNQLYSIIKFFSIMAKITKLNIVLPKEKTSVADVLTQARSASKGMTTHKDIYPAPEPPIGALDTAIAALVAADVPEGDRSANTDLVLQERKVAVINILEPQSRYVLLVANGDRTKAAKSGFQLNVEETVSKPPGEFKAVFVKAGPDDGTAIVKIEERAGCAIFIVQLKADDKWVMIDAFNTLQFTVEGLPSGASILRIYGKKGTKKGPAMEIVVKAV